MSDNDPLFKAVDVLIQPQRLRLYREDTKRGEWQNVPSLYQMLTTSGQWSGGNNGGGAFGSRPVISTGVVSLVMEIQSAITEAATDYGRIITKTTRLQTCYCRPYKACPGFILQTERDYPAELRAIAANIPDQDQVVAWVEMLRRWAHEARTTLGLNPQRPQWARGARCPECGSNEAQTERDGETIRTPALAISWGMPEGEETDYHEDHDYKVRAVECRSCGMAWWRGPDLDTLVTAMFNAPKVARTG